MNRSRRLSGAALTLLTTVAAGAYASPASAASTGTARAVNSTVELTAGSGKTNKVVITRSGRTVTIDDRVPIKAGTGCKKVKGDKTRVRCTTSETATDVIVRLGSRNDTFTNRTGLTTHVYAGSGKDRLTGGSGVDWLFGGSGNDRMDGRSGNDEVYGESGNDVLHGGPGRDGVSGHEGDDKVYGDSGDDFVMGDGQDSARGRGADVISGGSGRDLVSYYNHGPVQVDLDGKPRDDGMTGEHDTVGADVEDITGGAGNDVLTGNDKANEIDGRDGDDRLWGRGGNDLLGGDTGKDWMWGQGGDDRLGGVDPYHPESEIDHVDGGTNATPAGDRCDVGDIDVHTGCERFAF